MTRIRPRQLLLVAATALLICWYAALMVSYVRVPEKLEGADFLAFYSAGRVAREYGFNHVYDLELQGVAQAHTAGVPVGSQQTLPANHPPFLYPFLGLVASLDYRSAYFCYALFLFFIVAAGLPSLYKNLVQNGWKPIHALVSMLGVLLFEPLFMSVLKGQDSALLLLGGLLWFSGLTTGKERLAGLGLALTLIRPQIAIVLAVPFIFKRGRIIHWFVAVAAVLGLFSILLVGRTGVLDYVQLIRLSAGGEGYGMAEKEMFNLTGMILRLFPQLNLGIIHIIGWIVYAVAIIVMSAVWQKSRSISFRHIALLTSISLVSAPHLHYHDLSLLVIPIIGLGLAGVRTGRWATWRAASMPLAVSVILLLCEFWDPVRFTVPYLMMIIFTALTWWYETH
jgi:hypothetical protein